MSSGWEVREVSDPEQWDDLVRASHAGTLFHTTSWQDCSPHTFVRLGVYRRGHLLAGAVVQVDDAGRGRLGSLAPYVGPVSAVGEGGGHESAVKLLAASLKERVPGAMFYTSPWFDKLQPFILSGFSAQLFYTTVVRIESPEAAWSKFAPNLRRNIRRAESDGLTVEITTAPSTLLALVRKSFSRQGREVWFKIDEAYRCIEELGRKGLAACFVTYDSGARPVAAAGVVWDWRRGYYILGGYDETMSHRGASSLALWHAITYTREKLRLYEFDLEGSHIPAIELFMRQFGGGVVPFYYVTGGSNPFFVEAGA